MDDVSPVGADEDDDEADENRALPRLTGLLGMM